MNTTQQTTPTTPTTAATTRPWFRHPAAIAVGATAGALLVIGGSVAIALELTDDLWSPEYRSQPAAVTIPVAPVGEPDEFAAADPLGVAAAPDDSQGLMAAIESAVAVAGGVGATSVATGGGRFEVDVLLADGREIDVYVGADGAAVIDSVPYVDPSGDPAIDQTRIPTIVDAALAAVRASTGSTGTIAELSTTSIPGRAFDIAVLLPTGSVVYLELANDLSVVELDLD